MNPLPNGFYMAFWNMDMALPRFHSPAELYQQRVWYYNILTNSISTLRQIRDNSQLSRLISEIERRDGLTAAHWTRILADRFAQDDFRHYGSSYEIRHIHAIRRAIKIYRRNKATLDLWLAERMRVWHEKVILPRKKTGQIIARNRKEGKEDRIYEIHYDEKKHPFWLSAFSDLFIGGKDAEGRVVMKVKEIGTSQEAIGAYCEHLRDPIQGRRVMEAVFYEAAQRSPQEGSEALDQMAMIGRLWDNPKFAEMADSMLSDYIDATLYRTELAKDKRLALFVSDDILKARVAWEGIFNTSEKRETLAVQLNMPNTRRSAFRRCETIQDLIKYVEMVRGRRENPMDRVPRHLIERRDRASDAYEAAIRGTRVGMFGWHWSSEEIDMATNKLRTVNKEIHDWLKTHPNQTSPDKKQIKRTRSSLCVA